MSTAALWWDPDYHALRRPLLSARNRMRDAVRGYFRAAGFEEIETACLQVSPGNETHLNAFETTLAANGSQASRYLHTSPEFACKKLLAAGESQFFTLAPTFRNGEWSRLHAPEFTMLEWYHANRDFDDLLTRIAELLSSVATSQAVGSKNCEALVARHRDTSCDLSSAPERITVARAVERASGLALADYVSADPQSPAPGAEETLRFARAVEATGLSTADDDDWSDIFSKLMTEYVEPTLGHGRPTLLTHYPACEAALAQLDEKDPRFAERVELYVCGVEVANGFAELTDGDALQRRFENQMDEMERRYSRRYPIDADFITAVSSMPAANGCALGFDRLVMLATAAPSVHDVIWTPAAPIT